MPKLQEAVDALETLYPLRYAESWDAPGLIVGDLDAPVTRIAFAADPTHAVIEQAIGWHADLLVTHHPLFFRAVHETSGAGVHGAIVSALYRHGCALWVGHTNADAAFRGVGQAAADAFGLHDLQPLEPIDDPQSPHAVGIGRVGRLAEPMPLRDFAQVVARKLPETEYGIQVAGELDAPVSTVAVLPGSGDSMFDAVRASGADVYVTSDLRHHPATDALEQARWEASLRQHGLHAGNGDGHLRPALINTPHSAIESLWFRYALEDVPAAIAARTGQRPEVKWINMRTDPWDLVIR